MAGHRATSFVGPLAPHDARWRRFARRTSGTPWRNSRLPKAEPPCSARTAAPAAHARRTAWRAGRPPGNHAMWPPRLRPSAGFRGAGSTARGPLPLAAWCAMMAMTAIMRAMPEKRLLRRVLQHSTAQRCDRQRGQRQEQERPHVEEFPGREEHDRPRLDRPADADRDQRQSPCFCRIGGGPQEQVQAPAPAEQSVRQEHHLNEVREHPKHHRVEIDNGHHAPPRMPGQFGSPRGCSRRAPPRHGSLYRRRGPFLNRGTVPCLADRGDRGRRPPTRRARPGSALGTHAS